MLREQIEKEKEEIAEDFDVDNPYRKGVPLYNNSYDYENDLKYIPKGDTSSDKDIDEIDIH